MERQPPFAQHPACQVSHQGMRKQHLKEESLSWSISEESCILHRMSCNTTRSLQQSPLQGLWGRKEVRKHLVLASDLGT